MALRGISTDDPQPPTSQASKPRLVVLSGAGMSVESGLCTFRGNGGLWRNYSFERFATFEMFTRDPEVVMEIYNERRAQLAKAQPNEGHLGLALLEERFDLTIITQNVDDLHERARSSRVIHLHGQLRQARSTVDDTYVVDIGYAPIRLGDRCPRGGQLRPNIVWFGEEVTEIGRAIEIVSRADIFVVIGTSLAVYPAAGLLECAPEGCPVYLIDPNPPKLAGRKAVEVIASGAAEGVRILAKSLRHNP